MSLDRIISYSRKILYSLAVGTILTLTSPSFSEEQINQADIELILNGNHPTSDFVYSPPINPGSINRRLSLNNERADNSQEELSDSLDQFNEDQPDLSHLKLGEWRQLERGIHLAEIVPKQEPEYGAEERKEHHMNYPITIVKINPRQRQLIAHARSQVGENNNFTVADWTERFDLSVAINAGMFNLADHSSCTGYMRIRDHENNPDSKNTYNSMFVFGPREAGLPTAQILERNRNCNQFPLAEKYDNAIQGIRMVSYNSCTKQQRNAWTAQPAMWSTAAVGMDHQGNVLFIHSRTPYRVHDFNEILLSYQGIRLKNLMYLEGGPEASLNLDISEVEQQLIAPYPLTNMGSYEWGFKPQNQFLKGDTNHQWWNIPNIIGVERSK